MKRTYQVFILIMVMLGVLASGCFGERTAYVQAPDEVVQDSAYDLKGEGAYPREEYDNEYPSEPGSTVDSHTGETESAEFRKIITTSDLTIEVDDATSAVEAISKLAQEAGGFVSGSSVYDNYYNENTRKSGYITIRVPQSGFTSVLEKIELLGSVTSKSTSGRDVTEEYIDLSARLANLERQEVRLLEILNMTATVEEVLSVEKELERVRGEIESLTGRLNYLNDRVDFSTINVHVAEPRPITHAWGLRDALSDSVQGFISTVNAMIVLIGYILPILIFLTVVGGITIFIKKRVYR
ncbi:MAG: DUF4349 domain-containing protein [Methanosarcinaceae archaeon]|nr:DUF4349 domain-containing protein [Methanosarcinaceae archaeon]